MLTEISTLFQLFRLRSCLFMDKQRSFIQDELLKAHKHREHHVNIHVTGVWFGCDLTVLTSLSTILQLYRDGQF